ncbi:MAG: DNA recombination protein RmuC [Rhodospirillaceae bacterium]|nr:DNA recombination protein RmuC [Rhodospirillaceae bacterium]
MELSPILLALLGLIALLLVAVLVLVWRARGPAPVPALDPRLDQLAGQLQSLSANQVAAQSALDQRLEQRLAQLADRVQERLALSATEAGQSLGELKERLAVIDAAQKNIAELSTRMVSLQDILSNKQARGAFGEVQLADIVRTVMAPVNYEFQATLTGGKRVDCLLKLPNPPGPIGIDSKFPLESYRSIRDAQDDAATVLARREFSAAIRLHVKAIAEKYIVPGETADSALMFVPSEAVYAEVHANFPNLVEEAGRLRVWIVSPTTLMATLTTMRAVLKDVRMREQAHVIQAKVVELGKDIERLDERAEKLQKHFDGAVESVRQIRITTDKVVKKVDDIEKVGLEEPEVVTALVANPVLDAKA